MIGSNLADLTSKIISETNGIRQGAFTTFHTFCILIEKNAAEMTELICSILEDALIHKTCKKWFQRFCNGDFGLSDRERPRQPNKFEDEELEQLLEENSTQTEKELAHFDSASNFSSLASTRKNWEGRPMAEGTELICRPNIIIEQLQLRNWTALSPELQLVAFSQYKICKIV